MYLERLMPPYLAVVAAPRCFLHRLRHRELVSFGLLANLVRLARLPRFAGIDAIVDVGANVGQFAYMAHVAWPGVPVHSFEPDPRVYACLEQTFRRFRLPGSTHAAAVGDAPGDVTLHVQRESVNSSLLPRRDETALERIAVPCTTLDMVFAEAVAPRRALLKLDTQGTELEVLRGASVFLPRCAALLLEASVIPAYEGGVQLAELLVHLRDAGFVPFDIVDVLRTPQRDGGALRELDLLFVRAERPPS